MPPKEGASKENNPASREDPVENESSYETVTEEEIDPPPPRALAGRVAVKSAAAPKPLARAAEESDEEIAD